MSTTRRNGFHHSAGSLNYYHQEHDPEAQQQQPRRENPDRPPITRRLRVSVSPPPGRRTRSVIRSSQRHAGLVTPPSQQQNRRLGSDLWRLMQQQQQQQQQQQNQQQGVNVGVLPLSNRGRSHSRNREDEDRQDHSSRSTGGIGRRSAAGTGRGIRRHGSNRRLRLWGKSGKSAVDPSSSDHSSDENEVNIREVPPHDKKLKSLLEQQKQKQQQQAQQTATKIRQSHILQMTRRLQQQHSKRYSTNYTQILAILEFWRTSCPAEVSLKMLAFLGPQLVQKLQRTQRYIFHLLQYDVSWRVLCEELYKWRPGNPLPHGSWKDHYRFNPCVPVDFSDIGLALAIVGSGWTPKQYKKYSKLAGPQSQANAPEIQQNVTVWLRPRPEQPYQVAQAIPITTLRRTTQVTIRTMIPTSSNAGKGNGNGKDSPQADNQNNGSVPDDAEFNARAPDQEQPRPQLEECHPDSRRNVLNGGDGQDDLSESEDESSDDDDEQEEARNDSNRNGPAPAKAYQSNKMALLQSSTRRRNEPMFRVMRGQLILRQVAVEHSCLGVDIWNGNAAVHIQPTYLHTALPLPMVSLIPSATAVIEDSSITSISGRGIVTVDGGQLFSKKSYIHNCAATGVYIGGRGSSAILKHCDVWQNGVGNPQMAGGISRGHSGIYVEQAKSIELQHCSVAYNTASGISMIGSQMPVAGPPVGSAMQLSMSHSSISSNGFSPIDIPHGPAPVRWNGGDAAPPGPFDQQPWQHASLHNRIEVVGVPQAESSPLRDELERQKELKRKHAMEKKLRRKIRRQQKRAVAAARQAAVRAANENAARELDWNATAPWNNK
mmetsp:Transcript_8957/g.19321  ORF Transcript_8957/g.19321 Transcript_8957/m.19321 type:complete len:827 (+) Transcript_8957:194-2674(+)